MTDKEDFYGENSALYAEPSIRPVYPAELFELIYAFAGFRSGTALDVATGTGQCAQVLAETFSQVLAVDSSAEQLQQCKANSKIRLWQAPAEDTGVESGSIDLVTVATALHWFDIPAFYREARRVLRPTGVLATWAYKLPEVVSNQDANQIFAEFYDQTFYPNIGAVHRIWLDEYRGHEPSETDFQSIKRETLGFTMEYTIERVMAFIRTNGLYTQYRRSFPDRPDPLQKLRQELMSAVGAVNEEHGLTLHFPVFLVLAKQPKPLQ